MKPNESHFIWCALAFMFILGEETAQHIAKLMITLSYLNYWFRYTHTAHSTQSTVSGDGSKQAWNNTNITESRMKRRKCKRKKNKQDKQKTKEGELPVKFHPFVRENYAFFQTKMNEWNAFHLAMSHIMCRCYLIYEPINVESRARF